MTDSVVYTALIGMYEELVEQPIAHQSGVEFVCFTDNPYLRSDTWRIVVVEPVLPWDPVRSARYLKICVRDDLIRDYKRSLWIDNRVLLRWDPKDYLDWALRDSEVGIPYHSYRRTVGDEFDAVLRAGIDSPERVRELRDVLSKYAPAILDERPLWTGMLARAHTAEVAERMQGWWRLVLRHSRRDQLSVNYVLRDENAFVRRFALENFGSQWHEWLDVVRKRDIQFATGASSYSLVEDLTDRFRRTGVARKILRRLI